MIYHWKLERQYPVEAQVVGEEIEALRVRHNGHLTPRSVVDNARAENSPLHPLFEWDDEKAAAAHREHQASDVLRSIVVQLPERPYEAAPTRAFVSVRVENEPIYTSVQTALSDEAMREQMLAQAMRDLQSWRRRYNEINELAALFAQIDMFKPPEKK